MADEPKNIDIEDDDETKVESSDDAVSEYDHDDEDENQESFDDEDDESDDRASGSWAGRVLTGLVLVCAGGGLALWGGPKVAPHLPQGLAPVAQFLTPGQDAVSAEISAVNENLASQITELRALIDANVSDAELGTALDAMQASTNEQVKALSDQVASVDGGAIEARLARVETGMAGMSASLEKLSDSLTGQSEGGAGIDANSVAAIAAMEAKFAELNAQIESLSQSQGQLNQKIDEVEVTSNRLVSEAETEAEAVVAEATNTALSAQNRATLDRISAAIISGAPFEGELANIDGEIPEALLSIAQSGVPSLADLQKEFPSLAHESLRASARSESGEGLGAKLSVFLKSQVGTRSLTPQEGTSTDAILSRMEAALKLGDLNTVKSEASGLSAQAAQPLETWISNINSITQAQNSLGELASTLGQ